MFKKSIITRAPSGRFHFVGRVHVSLMNSYFDTIEDAKIAAMNVMIETGETFPVDVQAIGE
jgi:predicted PP-loop superfamily ATPase